MEPGQKWVLNTLGAESETKTYKVVALEIYFCKSEKHGIKN